MDTLLSFLRQEKGLVDIYLYNDEKVITGFVAEGKSDLLFIKRVSEGPKYDGGSLIMADDISRLHRGSRALESQKRMLSDVDEPEWPGLDLSNWHALAAGLKMSGAIVKIITGPAIHPNIFVGKIVHFTDQLIEMDAVGTYDDPDRSAVYLRFTDLVRIDFNRTKDEDLYAYNMRALGPG